MRPIVLILSLMTIGLSTGCGHSTSGPSAPPVVAGVYNATGTKDATGTATITSLGAGMYNIVLHRSTGETTSGTVKQGEPFQLADDGHTMLYLQSDQDGQPILEVGNMMYRLTIPG